MNHADLLDLIKSVRSRLELDTNDLDTECKQQPSFYHEIAGELAVLRSKTRTTKSVLEYERARLETEIRKRPTDFGLEKVTVDAVNAAVVLHPDYQKALSDYNNAETMIDSVSALVIALDQRKSMLRDLVKLYIYSYGNSDISIRGSENQLAEARENEIRKVRKDNAGKRRKPLAAGDVIDELEEFKEESED